jgi:two-component system sensor histidine kinase KdpD
MMSFATEVPFEELAALSLRSLRRAPTGLAALLSAAAGALDSEVVAAALVSSAVPPDTLAAGGPDGPALSQRAGEDHDMIRKLASSMEPTEIHPHLRAGKWTEYPFAASISSCIDDEISCVVIVAGNQPIDLRALQRYSAPIAVLGFVIAQDRRFRDIKRGATEAEQELSLLLAGLHHDLRTPLTGILGSARTIITRDEQLAQEDRSALLEGIVRQAERLNLMVGDALTRDRDRDRPVRTSSLNLRHLAERAAAAAMLGREGLVTVEASDMTVSTDGDRLERALLNLLDNALKYAPTDSPVYLVVEGRGGWATFTVADRGPGVAQDVLPRLFAPYVSDPSRSDGTGLGLNSAKQVIESDLKGRISYSRHEGWTRFVITVPTHG